MAVIGLGSNLLAADSGFDGLVVAGRRAGRDRPRRRCHQVRRRASLAAW
jgi:UDP-N-acetylenolpyruvoylglucosamine reductase